MKIYKSAIDRFLIQAERYYRNGRPISELREVLESHIAFDLTRLDTDQAKFARSNILKRSRILDVIEALCNGQYLEGIGGQPIAGLACAWDTLDVAGIRVFLES